MGVYRKESSEVAVSIIIPAYNEREYIYDCVMSVVRQRCKKDFEILVCDDSSSDGTRELLAMLEDEQSQVTVLRNSENRGIIGTVNRLTEAANGDFLLRIDADSVLLPGTVRAMYDAFNSGAKLVFGRVEVKNTCHLHPTAATIGKIQGRGTWYGGACIGVDRAEFVRTGGFKRSMVGAEVQELKQRASTHEWTVVRLDDYGVESNFPTKLRPVLRRKFDAGRTHINQYVEEPETYSLWELRGPIFWTVLLVLGAGSVLLTQLAVVPLLLLLIPMYQYSSDAKLAAEISGRRSFIVLYPLYRILGGVLRTFGVWTAIDNVFALLWKKYLV